MNMITSKGAFNIKVSAYKNYSLKYTYNPSDLK